MTIDRFQGRYYFLSNFSRDPVVYQGHTYPTVEHAYQAAKTLDWEDRARIRQASKPGDAKKAGQLVQLRPDWELVKILVMFKLLARKFNDDPLRSKLLATAPRTLEEGNTWHDQVWGRCYCGSCNPERGENYLGRMLMILRDSPSFQ